MPTEKLDAGIPILVADSDPWAKASLKRIFKEFQFSNITFADNAYKANHQGRFENYSLLLIGDDLEKGDSINLISQIRTEGKNTQSPIIFMYKENQEDLGKQAESEGVSATIQKQVQEPDLRELIENLLEKYILTITLENEQNQENLSATFSGVDLGQKLMAQGDMEGAEAAFEEAMVTGGGSVDVFYGLAEVYLARGDEAAAEQVLDEAVRIDPLARDKFRVRDAGLIQEGQKFLANGDLEKAEEAFEEAVVKGGDGIVDALCGMAEVSLAKGDTDAAERALLEAEKIEPTARDRLKKHEPGFVAKGDQYLEEEKLEDAETAYKSAVVVNKNSVAGKAGLGEVYKAMGNEKAAAEAFEDALSSDEAPDDLHVYNKMGITARKDKNFGIAIRSFDRALSFDPDDPVLYYNKSLVFIAQSQFEESLELLKKALKLKPDFVQAEQTCKKVKQFMKT